MGFFKDCRHAVRLYRRTPGGSLIALGVLAVSTAFVGAFLSLYVDQVLRPLPGFEESGHLATVGQSDGEYLRGFPYEIVAQLADEMTTIEAAAMLIGQSTFVGQERQQMVVWTPSEEFFSGLRPRMAFGRGLQVADHTPDAEPVVVLSHAYWQRRFGGDRDVLGELIEINWDSSSYYGGPDPFVIVEPEQKTTYFRIVGVLAKTFKGVPASSSTEYPATLWMPLERVYPLYYGTPDRLLNVTSETFVRRADGVSTADVAKELNVRYAGHDSRMNRPGTTLDAIDGMSSNISVKETTNRQLEMFLASSVLLALVAAANVSLFLLARASVRRRELGIRMAIGAPLKRLTRQLVTEAGLLVIVSAALGLVFSVWIATYLRSLALFRDAQWHKVTLTDWRVLSLAGAFLLALTLLVSLAPIAELKRLGIPAASRQAATRASLAQRIAGTVQIAVAGTLGGAAIAFAWYVGAMMLGDPGYETRDRYFVRSDLQSSIGNEETLQIEIARWRDAIEAIPGVIAMGYGEPIPGGDYLGASPRREPDPMDPTREIEVYSAYFEREFVDLLGLRLIRGRAPESGETAVNETLARELWGREDVVGERIPFFTAYSREGAEVVGVFQDISFGHPAAAARPYVFAGGGRFPSAVVHSQMTAGELQQAIDRSELSGDLEVDVVSVEPLKALRDELIAPDRARGILTVSAATLVVVLAAFGFYGTQRFLVAAGRREYAIRASLGAGRAEIGRLVLRRGILLGLPGLVLGSLLAFIVVAYLRDDYVSRDVSPGLVTLGVVVGLGSILLAASLGPVREARDTQPAPLLRED